jgi:hypothetical protein
MFTLGAAWRGWQDSRAAAVVKQLGRRCRCPGRISAREPACAVARLGCKGFQLQAVSGGEVLDVGGEERQVMHDGGGADQGIGQAHAVR